MAHFHLATALVVAGVVSGCGAEPAPRPAPVPAWSAPTLTTSAAPRIRPLPEPPAFEAFPSPAGEPKFKRVTSKRLRLSIPLPNRSGWKMKREKSTFLIMEHAATSSKLLVGLWREDALMNRAKCEERARWLRELPKRGDGLLSSRVVSVPDGFDTHVDVGYEQEGEAGPLRGWALAFGGKARECFAFIFTTTAEGEGAERMVGDRLAVMQTLCLEGVERRFVGGVEREQ